MDMCYEISFSPCNQTSMVILKKKYYFVRRCWHAITNQLSMNLLQRNEIKGSPHNVV